MKTSLLQGMLPWLQGLEGMETLELDSVNSVNAGLLADAAHVRVAVKHTPVASGPYANAIRVTVVSPSGSQSVTGSVIEGVPRVVQVDHWQSFPSFVPQGHVILFNNIDKPGSVGRVTSLLAEYNINIAAISVARQYPGSPALSVVIVDTRVPSVVKEKLDALDGIMNVRVASFDGADYVNPSPAGSPSGAAGGAGPRSMEASS